MARGRSAGSPGELPAPVAQRLRRPSWRDPRLAIGMVLVLGSVVAGGRVVAAADDTQAVYATTESVSPGDALDADRLRVVRAKLPDGAATYLLADRPIPSGAVALRGMAAGELVPLSSVGEQGAVGVQAVGIQVAGQLPDSIRKSTYVEIWAAEVDPDRAQHYLGAELLAGDVEVAQVQEGSSALGASSAVTVQVLLRPQDVPVVFSAMNNKALIRLALDTTPGSEETGS